MIRSDDITSFSEHRQRLRDHLTRVKETGRPLYITTNGQTEAVVLSPDVYDRWVEKVELAETLMMIDRSAEDIRAGRVHEARQAMRDIAREHGIDLDR